MPKKKTGEDETPRRRRGAAAAVAAPERGLLLRVLLYSPKDMVAGLIAFAAASAIITNALFLQSGPHPAPMFGTAVSPPNALLMPNPLPRPRPADADVLPLVEPKRSDSSLFDPKPVEPPPEPKQVEQRSVVQRPAEPRIVDPMASLVRATTSTSSPSPSNALRPPAPIPTTGSIGGGKRVAAVQRVLTEYGYAQLKPSGTLGPDTKAAIEKFERERRLPVDGQVSDRLVRELYAATGHAVE
ncbi:peptidoglycan-binding domain-containing protein [Bradyrhizobium sp. Tv2a-2]|uniref:peptidoglycan-binding domain-containing protein n=1 Tax=Bradyrhizobium sp. Tv2a-2 TaxID=113395 RepID=UPI00040678A6|nr:peptidoglycan-binding domain-containing protein [Bradyrhizobium sp. Tv2a-2]